MDPNSLNTEPPAGMPPVGQIPESSEGRALAQEPGPELTPDVIPFDDSEWHDDSSTTPEPQAPAQAPELAGEPAASQGSDEEEGGGQGQPDEDAEFVQQMDAYLQQAQVPFVPVAAQQVPDAQAAIDQAQQALDDFKLTDEQAEEIMADPSKLTDVFREFGRNILGKANQAIILASQRQQIETIERDMKAEADRFYEQNPHLNQPHLKYRCAQVCQQIIEASEKSGKPVDWRDAFKYTAKYVTARMKTHPHEFSAKKGLPSLRADEPPQAAPLPPAAQPQRPARPVFAGGGGAARRSAPRPPKVDSFQEDLDSLKPEDAWG